jgi:hypothetical protein
VGEVAAPRQRLGRVAHARFDEGGHRLSRLLDKARHVLREPLRIADVETESPRRLHWFLSDLLRHGRLPVLGY